MKMEMIVVLILVVSAVAAQKELPCMTTQSDCSGMMSGSIINLNNNYLCCGAGFSMRRINNNCTCVQTAEVKQCSEGVAACQGASSFTNSPQRGVRCCQNGFSMISSSSYVNGQMRDDCKCLRYFSSGGSSSSSSGSFFNGMFMGNGRNGVFMSSGFPNPTQGLTSVDPNFNATAFQDRMNAWGQQFSAQMHGMRQRLQNSMQALQTNLQAMGTSLRSGMQGLGARMQAGIMRGLRNALIG